MKIKTSMRRLENAQVNFISLVSRGANRIPFRILKSEGENKMLDLTQLRHAFKSEAAPPKPTGKGYAHILKANPFRASKAPETVAKAATAPQAVKAASAPSQPAQQAQQRQTEREPIQEEQPRQQLAPHQPLHATPAPRRAGNVPKQPAPARDTVTLKELRGAIDNALAFSKKQVAQEQFNSQRSAFSQIAPTQPHHVGRGGAGDAWALRNHGAQLAVQLLGGTDKPLPANTALRPYSAAGSKA
ncbi:hypothetical protein HS961_20720 [Comamonas piscis]|uniref:Uncharacterized protein n=1 Tax=Comamonas piscis TaxID=1562974 RepID=A0A7G5EM45_9BURK|nr:hypothetical protein [Comamonas piscis]QMV75070.1 hypothetical protein HS961_20720 [Comamonas piscis]WSO33554.1 hypothetical protein VUJ63_20785 [Comamonas piscis]